MVDKWVVYYDNGVMLKESDGLPEDAPSHGVIAIWQADPNDKLFNKDYYLWREDYGCWIEVDWNGLIDHLTIAARQITAVLVGRTIPGPAFVEVIKILNSNVGK